MDDRRNARPAESRPPILEDVARLAGVSAMTVSRVLNSPEKVRPQTRDRVMAAVRTLGYRPKVAVHVPASGRSGVIGVVTVDAPLYGAASLLYAIEQAARRHGCLISVVTVDASDHRALGESLALLRGLSADGIIVGAPLESVVDGLRGLPADLPLVVVGAAEDVPFPVVTVDQRAGAARAVRHMLSLGHETVWHLAGPTGWADADGRRDGWRNVLESEGRPVPEPVAGDWSARSGYEQGRLLARDPEITAVFAANDDMALGLQRALWEAGRAVPEEVSVAGFDDVPESGYAVPPLTTVRQEFREVGRRAVQLLLDRLAEAETGPKIETELLIETEPLIESGAAPGDPVRVLIEPELVVRESTGPHRRPR